MSHDYFMKGAISGATGILLSHPIDTIKSNVQDHKPIKTNFRFLFRGIIPPFIGMGFEKAVVFGVYHNARLLLNGPKYRDRIIAGGVAGFAASFVVTPVERLKILSQTNSNLGSSKNIKPKMSIGYLYRGFSSTLTREMPGFAIYFSSYEAMKDTVSSSRPTNTIDHFVMGGISGFLAWGFIYPQDLVKTQIQASTSKVIKPGAIIKNIYKTNGIKGFFRGFHLALLRAVPLHAGTFAMFEYLNNKY